MRHALCLALFLLLAIPAWGAVAFDATSESHTASTGSANEASFSWSHDPVGTPRGILVCTFVNADADIPTSVTYGGVSVPAVSGGMANDSLDEPRRCKTFFLGVSVPVSDPATIVVNRVNNANIVYAVAMTITAGADTEVHTPNIVLLSGDGTLAEQAVDDGSIGIDSLRAACIASGLGTHPAVGANTTEMHFFPASVGGGSFTSGRETVAGQGSRSVGFFDGVSDDRAGVHLAIREIVSVAGPSYLPGSQQPKVSQ